MDKVTAITANNETTLHIWKLDPGEVGEHMTKSMVRGSYDFCFIVRTTASNRGKSMFYLGERHRPKNAKGVPIGPKVYDGWYASGKPHGGEADDFKVLLDTMIADAWKYA